MNKLVCDICGKEQTSNDIWSSFKLKKESTNPFEPRWIRLDVHLGCWHKLCDEISERSGNNK